MRLKKFAVWGFGGAIDNMVSHCFPLTMDEHNVQVHGVQGILDVYNKSFEHVALCGPTNFSEVIQTAASMAVQFSNTNQSYYILLIITDGVITDMDKTIETIVDASDKALSIVIVGVGEADFGPMVKLDRTSEPLVFNGKKMARSIVQFVSMRELVKKDISQLSKATLEEIPTQVIDFMKLYKGDQGDWKGTKHNGALANSQLPHIRATSGGSTLWAFRSQRRNWKLKQIKILSNETNKKTFFVGKKKNWSSAFFVTGPSDQFEHIRRCGADQ